MLIFYWGGGRGQGESWATVLSILVPLVIQFLMPLLFGGGAFQVAYVYDEGFGWRRMIPGTAESQLQRRRAIDVWDAFVMVGVMLALIMGFVVPLILLARNRRRESFWRILRRGYQRASNGVGSSARHRERRKKLDLILQSIPTQTYHAKEELNKLSVRELKDLIQEQHSNKVGGGRMKIEKCFEKSELVECLLDGQNSTNQSCSICLEQYESNELLRMLPCGHQFHAHCVDKWLYSSIDYSRPSACPVCNARLTVAETCVRT